MYIIDWCLTADDIQSTKPNLKIYNLEVQLCDIVFPNPKPFQDFISHDSAECLRISETNSNLNFSIPWLAPVDT